MADMGLTTWRSNLSRVRDSPPPGRSLDEVVRHLGQGLEEWTQQDFSILDWKPQCRGDNWLLGMFRRL